MKKNAKLAALAILVLAAVAALSVGITLAVVNARMPAACSCSGQCRSAGTESAAAGDAPSAQQTEPSDPDSISIPGFDFLSLQAGTQEQNMPLYNPENNACYYRISLLLDGEALWRSDLLAPEQTAPQQTLSRALAAGEYSAVLKYECFADEAETVFQHNPGVIRQLHPGFGHGRLLAPDTAGGIEAVEAACQLL